MLDNDGDVVYFAFTKFALIATLFSTKSNLSAALFFYKFYFASCDKLNERILVWYNSFNIVVHTF